MRVGRNQFFTDLDFGSTHVFCEKKVPGLKIPLSNLASLGVMGSDYFASSGVAHITQSLHLISMNPIKIVK